MGKASGLQQVVLTYEDYVHFPVDGKRYEILEGEVFVTPAPKTKHQIISLNLAVILQQHVRKHKLGRVLTAPTDVILSRTNVVQPDLLFLSNERLRYLTDKNVQGTPDLMVEILSEFTQEQDRTAKMQIYARHGVKVYWLIDPDAESLEIYELDSIKRRFRHSATFHGPELLHSDLFPHLKLSLTDLWL